ncbi:MAG: hypothetical protein QF464_06580, partial [Myxococcota bacterium]|nr:hypothetical protein [Myxococcota bacterium]
MLNDPMVWALVLIALMPTAVRRALAVQLATASTGRIVLAGLILPVGVLFLLSGTASYIGLTLITAALIFPCMAAIGRAERPWVRGGTLAALAMTWTLQLSTTVPFVRWGPDEATPFWFIDLFNRLVDAGMAPLLIQLGGTEALVATLEVARAPMAALSHHLFGLHALTSGLVIFLLYGTVRPFAPQLATFPPPTRWRVPRAMLALYGVAAG